MICAAGTGYGLRFRMVQFNLIFVYDSDMVDRMLLNNATLRKRLLLGAMALLLAMALACAYAVTLFTRLKGH